ncbi:MAG: GlsB/YeaQ/YmgE family stress response membrane protein [Amaricoccus sp.]
MSGLGWFSFLIVGLIAGWVADQVMKRDHGLVENLIVGVIGAYVGAFLFRLFGLAATGFVGALVVAIIGSVVLLWIVGMVRKRG